MDYESLIMSKKDRIKSSFCTNIMPLQELPEAIKSLANLGYDGVELWDNFLRENEIDWISELLNDNKIRASQICPYFNFTGSPEEWNESIQIAEEYIDFALKLNKPLIRVFTGHVGGNDASTSEWEKGVEGIKKICEMGFEDGIRFALETHGGSLMESTDSTLRLLNDVNMENLGVNLQVPLNGEDIWETLEKLASFAIHIHAHNWVHDPYSSKAHELGESNLTFLDQGWLDFDRFTNVLIDKGYFGYISIEHSRHGGKHSWKETAVHEIEYLKQLKKYCNVRETKNF